MNVRMQWNIFSWLALALLTLNNFELSYATQLLKGQQQDDFESFWINKKLYEVSRIKADWYFAKIECNFRGMDLLSIETLDEQREIEAVLGDYVESFWTAGCDNEQNNYFYWETTGHAFGPFYNWGSNQPGDGVDQNCVILNHADGFSWYDVGCSADQLRFVCEEKELPPSVSFTHNESFYEVSAQKLDWWSANYACKSRGMALANIQSQLENDAIRSGLGDMKTETIWIAATDLGREGDFYWDGIGDFLGPFTYWNASQPNNADGTEHCVHMFGKTQQWNDDECTFLHRYLCEGILPDEGSINKYDQGSEAGSTNGQFSGKNSTYEISTIKVDWYLAKVECQIRGMELLSIETQEEQDAISDLIYEFGEDFWMSGNADANHFSWDSTGHTMLPANYENWAPGEPDVVGQNCVILNNTDSYRWYDFGCKADTLRFICEKKDSREDQTTTFVFEDNTYEVAPLMQNWWQANRNCRSRNMSLISIESAAEAKAIQENIRDFGSLRFWIAATDLGSENDFYWDTTGDLIGPYTNWALNEPNNDKDNEHCVVLASSGLAGAWNDVPCTLSYRYICKMKT